MPLHHNNVVPPNRIFFYLYYRRFKEKKEELFIKCLYLKEKLLLIQNSFELKQRHLLEKQEFQDELYDFLMTMTDLDIINLFLPFLYENSCLPKQISNDFVGYSLLRVTLFMQNVNFKEYFVHG